MTYALASENFFSNLLVLSAQDYANVDISAVGDIGNDTSEVDEVSKDTPVLDDEVEISVPVDKVDISTEVGLVKEEVVKEPLDTSMPDEEGVDNLTVVDLRQVKAEDADESVPYDVGVYIPKLVDLVENKADVVDEPADGAG